MNKKKKRAFTLLEIMIVIALIAIIGTVIGVNMKGSLDEGRAFKTKQAMQQIEEVLTLMAETKGIPLHEVIQSPEENLRESGLVKDAEKLVVDGWGNPFDLSVVSNEIRVESKGLKSHEKNKKNKMKKKRSDEEE